LSQLREIVDGIDRSEGHEDDGWWETSTGAEFGADVLSRLEALIHDLT
jgi:hypothetical protein